MSGHTARFASLVFGVGVFLLLSTPHAAKAAVYHNVSGWAWSGTTGWISMDCNNEYNAGSDPTPCDAPHIDYGLDINSTGNIAGWAWSTQVGWICFGATCTPANGAPPGGTPNSPVGSENKYCFGNNPCAKYEAGAVYKVTAGNVHGWAYVLSQTSGTDYRGWISLNCEDIGTNTTSPHSCPSSDYGVRFLENATQTAGEFNGYAWNGNGDSTGSGWIQFGCGEQFSTCGGAGGKWGVTSGWVDSGWTSIQPIEGIYSPPGGSSTLTDIPIVFKAFSAPANSTLDCSFRMSNNTYQQLSVPIPSRISRTDHTEIYTVKLSDSTLDTSGNPILWTFSSSAPSYGCKITGSPSVTKAVSNTIAVHPTGWTFAGPGGALTVDSLRAKFCLDGNATPDATRQYFLNTSPDGQVVQCDTEGDLALTLLRARGVPVEVKCYDNVDNDANAQRDCAGGTSLPPVTVQDRNCRGIAYLCISHPNAASLPMPPPLP